MTAMLILAALTCVAFEQTTMGAAIGALASVLMCFGHQV